MSNPLVKIIFIIVGVVIMFIVTPAYFMMKSGSVIQVNVDKETSELVERVTTQGYITRAMYEEYLEDLADTDKLYEVELSRELMAYEPEYRIRSSAEVIDEDEAGWTGTNPYDASPVHTDIPVVVDPINNGAVNTDTNESVLANASDTGATPGHVHSDACYAGHRHTDVSDYKFTHTHAHTWSCQQYLDSHILMGTCNNCGRVYNHYIFDGWWNSTNNRQEGQGFPGSCPACGGTSYRDSYELRSTGYSCGYDIDLNGDNLYDEVPRNQTYTFYRSYAQVSSSPYRQDYVQGCKTYHVCGAVAGYNGGSGVWWDDDLGGYKDMGWYDGPTAFWSFASNPYGFCRVPYGFMLGYSANSDYFEGYYRFPVYYYTKFQNGVLKFTPGNARFPELTPQQFFSLGDARTLRDFIHTYMGADSPDYWWVDQHVSSGRIRATRIEVLEYYNSIENTYRSKNIYLCNLASERWNLTCNWTPPADHDHALYGCGTGYICHPNAKVKRKAGSVWINMGSSDWTTETYTEYSCSECGKIILRLQNHWWNSAVNYSVSVLLRNKSTGVEELKTILSCNMNSNGVWQGDTRARDLGNTLPHIYASWLEFYKGFTLLNEPLPAGLSATHEKLPIIDILPPNPQDLNPVCQNMITDITPTHSVQTVYTNEPLITTILATYADGSTKTIVGTTSFSTANPVNNQSVTISYQQNLGGTVITKNCNITVTVIRRSKTCAYGHTYNLSSDGSDPGCPYCRNWLRSLTVYYPASGVLNMGRDPEGSLEAEGVSLYAIYLDGRAEIVVHGYTDNLDPDYVGTQTVTIGYRGLTTTLQVNVLRNKKQCDICGLYYNLYLDNADPGCPYCKANVPVFTGNVMKYSKGFYKEEIFHELYEGSGIYYFRRGDVFQVKTVSRDVPKVVSLFAKLFRLRTSVIKSNTVKDEEVFH